MEPGFGRSMAEGFKSFAATGLVWTLKLGQVFPRSAVIGERWSRGHAPRGLTAIRGKRR
jgi:hypothetical protein